MSPHSPGQHRLEDLKAEHVQLNDGFHQVLLAIVDRRLHDADRLLDDFAELMIRHIESEDQHWCLVFDEHFGRSRGFGADLLMSEHRVLERLVAAFRDLIHRLVRQDRELTGDDVLNLVADGFRVRGVMSHHIAREDALMIPALAELERRSE